MKDRESSQAAKMFRKYLADLKQDEEVAVLITTRFLSREITCEQLWEEVLRKYGVGEVSSRESQSL